MNTDSGTIATVQRTDAATAAAEVGVQLTVRSLRLDQLVESPTNPRKTFDLVALDELAASIAKQGVLQPILVRPQPVNGDGVPVRAAWPFPVTGNDAAREIYEIVAGARRVRAARIAGRVTIPAMVRDMDDRDVLEAQITENLQRADIAPLEEAAAYQSLIDLATYTIADVADRVARSEGYVRATLKLLSLGPPAREALTAGLLSRGTALLLARIPVPSLQDEATAHITQRGQHGVMTAAHARAEIERLYMCPLDGPAVTWRLDDATLIPGVGACTTCMRRSGNQLELFGDVPSDRCTDPGCYGAKAEAVIVQLRAAGKTVVRVAASHLMARAKAAGNETVNTTAAYCARALADIEQEPEHVQARLREMPTMVFEQWSGALTEGWSRDQVREARKARSGVDDGPSGDGPLDGGSGRGGAEQAPKVEPLPDVAAAQADSFAALLALDVAVLYAIALHVAVDGLTAQQLAHVMEWALDREEVAYMVDPMDRIERFDDDVEWPTMRYAWALVRSLVPSAAHVRWCTRDTWTDLLGRVDSGQGPLPPAQTQALWLAMLLYSDLANPRAAYRLRRTIDDVRELLGLTAADIDDAHDAMGSHLAESAEHHDAGEGDEPGGADVDDDGTHDTHEDDPDAERDDDGIEDTDVEARNE